MECDEVVSHAVPDYDRVSRRVRADGVASPTGGAEGPHRSGFDNNQNQMRSRRGGREEVSLWVTSPFA